MSIETFYGFIFVRAQQPKAGQGRLILEVCRSHTVKHHSRNDSCGRGIGLSQGPVPDIMQHSQETSMPLAGFEPTVLSSELPQTLALDRSATGVLRKLGMVIFLRNMLYSVVRFTGAGM